MVVLYLPRMVCSAVVDIALVIYPCPISSSVRCVIGFS